MNLWFNSFFYIFQALEKGQRFTLRASGVTLGYGVIANILPDYESSEIDKKVRMKAAEK